MLGYTAYGCIFNVNLNYQAVSNIVELCFSCCLPSNAWKNLQNRETGEHVEFRSSPCCKRINVGVKRQNVTSTIFHRFEGNASTFGTFARRRISNVKKSDSFCKAIIFEWNIVQWYVTIETKDRKSKVYTLTFKQSAVLIAINKLYSQV